MKEQPQGPGPIASDSLDLKAIREHLTDEEMVSWVAEILLRHEVRPVLDALAEARGKLKALVGLYIKHDSRSHYKDDRQCAACLRDAILGGSE